MMNTVKGGGKKLLVGSVCKDLQWVLWRNQDNCSTSSIDESFSEAVETRI